MEICGVNFEVITCPRKRRLTKNANVIMERAPNRNIITKSEDFPLKLPSSNILSKVVKIRLKLMTIWTRVKMILKTLKTTHLQ